MITAKKPPSARKKKLRSFRMFVFFACMVLFIWDLSQPMYKPNPSSLRKHTAMPPWLRDGKLAISFDLDAIAPDTQINVTNWTELVRHSGAWIGGVITKELTETNRATIQRFSLNLWKANQFEGSRLLAITLNGCSDAGDIWLEQLTSTIGESSPDLIWFNTPMDTVPDKTRMKFSATFLNHAQHRDRHVAIVSNDDSFPTNYTLRAKSVETVTSLQTDPWIGRIALTDQTAQEIIHLFIDTISKYGILMIDVTPQPDGTISDQHIDVLTTLGRWIKRNEQAVYFTHRFIEYAQGPTSTMIPLSRNYTKEDIRYTANDGYIYACMLGVPEPKEKVRLDVFSNKMDIHNVSTLGHAGLTLWERTIGEGLYILTPDGLEETNAIVFKVILDDFEEEEE